MSGPIVCPCCGEAKTTSQFSWNQKQKNYCSTCKECGQWLFLFRKVFGPTRDWAANVSNVAERKRLNRVSQRPENVAYLHLWSTWHQPTKDSDA